MIVDTSVLIAILRDEPEAPAFAAILAEKLGQARISAANFLEAAIVIDASRDPIASRRFDTLLEKARIQIVPVSPEQAMMARAAYRDFGKGSGHPAGLNFGDCFAYALAKTSGEPLLFKGSDFSCTDIEPELVPEA